WGGELKRDNFDVKMLQNRGMDRGVVIRHKKDLLGYEGNVDWKSPITRIMPQGFDGLFLPEKYVDSPLINKYPHPKIKVIEFKHIKAAIGENADDEDAVPLEEAYRLLRQAAKDMFTIQKVDQPKANYNVKFQELSQTEEYKDYKHLQSVYMADTVTVEHQEVE
ncbi:phage tail spike protein, partial [Bacillus cereus]|uniref:phage tail spike protein n=2 Tax=Bacillus cereus TaxID=1396 RepID=UPI003012EC67